MDLSSSFLFISSTFAAIQLKTSINHYNWTVQEPMEALYRCFMEFYQRLWSIVHIIINLIPISEMNVVWLLKLGIPERITQTEKVVMTVAALLRFCHFDHFKENSSVRMQLLFWICALLLLFVERVSDLNILLNENKRCECSDRESLVGLSNSKANPFSKSTRNSAGS